MESHGLTQTYVLRKHNNFIQGFRLLYLRAIFKVHINTMERLYTKIFE